MGNYINEELLMRLKQHALIWSMIFSSLLITHPAAAQNPDNNTTDEIVVKGKYLSIEKVHSVKTPTPIIDVPQSLSIFTAEMMRQQGLDSLGDIISYAPGVNSSQGEGHRDAVVFRGVRSTADFFIDGVRDDVQYYRPLYNIEQVEILRGPNALLFGRGGTGGALNRVLKKGVLNERFSAYSAGVDTFGEHYAQADGNLALGERAAARLNAYYAGLNNHRDFYAGERFGVNPSIRFEPGPATGLDISYEYIHHERFIDRGIPTGTDGRPVSALKDIVFADPILNQADIEAHVFRVALEHEFLDNLKGHFTVLHGDYDKAYQNFYASGYDQASAPDVVTTDGYVDATARENTIFSANLIGDFTSGGIEHTVLFGGEYIATSSDQDRFNAFWNTTLDDNEIFTIARPLNVSGGRGVNATGAMAMNSFTTDQNDDTRVWLDVYSVYIQDQLEVTDWLDVVLGARFDRFDISVFNVIDNETRTRADEAISPRAGVILKPRESISLYASYSESFLPRSGEQFANINGTANQLEPDEFASWEVGVKWDVAPTLSLTAAYFQNEQTRADRDNITGEQFEVRGLEIDGLELQLQGQLFERLSFYGGYSYLKGETGAGAKPRELPENALYFWGNYALTDRMGLGLGMTHQGSSLIQDGGAEVLPAYTRIDASAYYDFSDKIRLQFNIENLTDTRYFPHAHSTHQASVGAPINALFSVSGKF